MRMLSLSIPIPCSAQSNVELGLLGHNPKPRKTRSPAVTRKDALQPTQFVLQY